MEIKLLKTFVTVAKYESFSKAAQTLGYAQPTVTTHIQLLERELNTRLFERLGHRIILTPQGNKLLFYSENILKFSSDAIADLTSDASITSSITIGANESFSVSRLPNIFKHFMSHYPDIDVNLRFGSVDEIHQLLQNNSVDISFFLTREVLFPDLVIDTLISEPIVVVVSPDHPYSTKKSISIQELDNQVLILTQKSCTFRQSVEALMKQKHVHPHSIIETNNIEAIKQLVISNLGITVMPRISVANEIKQGQLCELTLNEAPIPVYTQLAYHKDKWLSPTIQKFIQEVLTIFK